MKDWSNELAPRARERVRAAVDLQSVLQAYRRYAPTYDVFFGPVFQWGRSIVGKRMNSLECTRILEVGVGTGLSLPLYGADKRIVGVDVSPEMLALARRRTERKGLKNVEALAEMNGEDLAFADGEFDAVVASYVMSVVPHPRRCLAEMERVCKPGGTVVVCNHFADGTDKWVTPYLEPLSRWLGWRPNFPLDEILDGTPLQMLAKESVPPFGLFNIVTFRKI